MTSTAVRPHLSGPNLMPGLCHIQNKAVLVERLKRERRVCRNFRKKTGVGIAIRIHDARLAQRNLTDNAQALGRSVVTESGAAGIAGSWRGGDFPSSPAGSLRAGSAMTS